MKNLFTLYFAAACLVLSFPSLSQKPALIGEKVKTMKAYEGFFNFYWDEQEGKIWLEIDKLDREFLYVGALSHGLGSNDVGLDRGQLSGTRIVHFHRIGPKVFLIENNYDFRAESDNPEEQKAVYQSFAKSVIWGFTIAGEERGTLLVDATPLLLSDQQGVSTRLGRGGQGSFSPDPSRSAIALERTKNFPKNTEFDVMITYKGNNPGRYVRSVTPTAGLVTVHQHHSFIELPDDHYTPRLFDPRAGYFGMQYMDFAVPLGEPMMKRFISRHRIKKKNPGAVRSEAVEPIVYYLDPGTPEPMRSALLEGASWWNDAFEEAGYINGFQIKMLPRGVDLLDVRYNVIQWVHRSTRGWSYGGSVSDPRTGEIIKGHVSLGSQRVRQDYLIAEGLLAPYETGKAVSEDMEKMALARLRQLSAHEVGHTLGLSHNYSASSVNRASVMDYPYPLIKLDKDGDIDLSDAYDTGIGEWDKIAINYGYREFPDNVDEAEALNEIISDYLKSNQVFLSDQDSRPQSASPSTHVWDNGTNAIDELERLLEIRKTVLNNFSEQVIREGRPMAAIEDVLVPAYMMHRYQIPAAAKALGGVYYNYAMRGDGQWTTRMVPAGEQIRALDILLKTLRPEVLALNESLIAQIPPRPMGFRATRELFAGHTGDTFDPLTAAESAAGLTIAELFNSSRAARLIEFHARNESMPDFAEVIEKTLIFTWENQRKPGMEGEIQRMVEKMILNRLIHLSVDGSASLQVRALALTYILKLEKFIKAQLEKEQDIKQMAHFNWSLFEISRYLNDPENYAPEPAIGPPPGAPIGNN